MAREDALSVFLTNGVTADKLQETYAEVVDMVQKGAISSQIKNVNLSGNPEGGSVEVKRLMTAASQDYGTARGVGEGDKVSNNGVTINLDTDKEIVEEVEFKDVQLYGIADILGKRKLNHEKAMIRELDTAFFAEAEDAGTEATITSSTIQDQVEELIQEVETTSNSNVDGVDRDMIVLTVKPAIFGQLRTYIDSLPNPVNGGVNVDSYHGVRIFSNNRQTADAICMVVGSIAQPVTATPYAVERIPMSNSMAVELFYTFGTKAVMADLIQYATFSEISV
jgi:hypothetical protein